MKKSFIILIVIFPFLTKAQTINHKLESADINAALKLVGLEIFKFNFNSVNCDYNLIIHIEEIGKDSVIKQKTYNFGQWQNENLKKEFSIISKVKTDTSEVYWINLIHPNMQILDRFDISIENRKSHFWKEIKEGSIEYEKKIPLLLYGMGWEDEYNGRKIMRFCWQNDIDRDLESEELKQINHMILISYELIR